jgi:hypothetical protein
VSPSCEDPQVLHFIFESAGQYLTYRVALKLQEPDRHLYLAVPKLTYDTLFQEILIQEVFRLYPVSIVVYSQTTQEIESWIN